MKKQVMSKSQLFGCVVLVIVAMTGIFTAKTDTPNLHMDRIENVTVSEYDSTPFLDVSDWNTKKVTNMDSMFHGMEINWFLIPKK